VAVYRGYSQAELDAQYDQRTLVPDLARYLARWREETASARRDLPGARGLAYGAGRRQRIDLFGARGPDPRPVLVYLHGGAWRQLSLEESGCLARPFVAAGAIVAAVDFDLVPDVTLDEQVGQSKAAVGWLIANLAELGGDPRNIVLCGHSSGAHLAAMAATGGVRVAGLALVSGCYDLEPVRLSARNDYLRLDPAGAGRNSPIKLLRPGLPPAVIAHGGGELDEFKRQARELAERWRETVGEVALIERAGLNHFDMNADIADTGSPLHRAVRRLMSLA